MDADHFQMLVDTDNDLVIKKLDADGDADNNLVVKNWMLMEMQTIIWLLKIGC